MFFPLLGFKRIIFRNVFQRVVGAILAQAILGSSKYSTSTLIPIGAVEGLGLRVEGLRDHDTRNNCLFFTQLLSRRTPADGPRLKRSCKAARPSTSPMPLQRTQSRWRKTCVYASC